MLRIAPSEEYVQKLLATPREGEEKILAFYEHRLGLICQNARLMLMPLDDHMAHRGDGVFESIKAEKNRIYQLPEHLKRLESSAAAMKLILPCARHELQSIILQVAAAGGQSDCMLRVLVGRGPGGFGIDPAECPNASLYVVAYKFTPKGASFFEKGLTAFKSSIPARAATVAKIKNTNYQSGVAMIEEAKQRGLDVALAFDEDGFLAEGAIANVCLVDEKNRLIVPEFSHALPGTTILRLMELAAAEMPVLTQKVRQEDVLKAKELLLTGTTVDCVAITYFEGAPIGQGKRGPLAMRLKALLDHDLRENGLPFQ